MRSDRVVPGPRLWTDFSVTEAGKGINTPDTQSVPGRSLVTSCSHPQQLGANPVKMPLPLAPAVPGCPGPQARACAGGPGDTQHPWEN